MVVVTFSRMPRGLWGKVWWIILPSVHTQWGTSDSEIKVPFRLRTQCNKYSPFKAWCRSEYSHACFAHYQECLLCLNFYFLGPFIFISFQILSQMRLDETNPSMEKNVLTLQAGRQAGRHAHIHTHTLASMATLKLGEWRQRKMAETSRKSR